MKNVEIRGLDRLIGKLNSLGKNTEKTAETARIRLAEMIQAQAKALAPVDEGQLRNSIEVQNGKDVSIVSTNVEHAIYNEFGTGKMGDPEVPHTTKDYWTYEKDGKFYTTHGMEPRPFMRPAAKYGEDQVERVFTETFEEAIREGKLVD